MKLTAQQIDDFNREGWLFLPELFSPEEVALLAHEAVNIYDTQRPEVWREKSGAPRTAFAAVLKSANTAFWASVGFTRSTARSSMRSTREPSPQNMSS